MNVYEIFFCGSTLGLYDSMDTAMRLVERQLADNPDYNSYDYSIVEREVKSG